VTTLTLIRHGQTDWNRDGRIQGTSDIPLNETGRQQARDTAAVLLDRMDPALPVAVAASDLMRARETAEIIADELDLPAPHLYPELRERNYGAAEGMTGDEIEAHWGTRHASDVPGAEPWPQVRRRAVRGVRQVARDVRKLTAPGAASVIVVSHGALIRELVRHISHGDLPDPATRLPNGGGYSILIERDRLRLVDTVAH
jgi:probable phosphoglycerate mutase